MVLDNVSRVWKIAVIAGAALTGAFLLWRATRRDPLIEKRRKILMSLVPKLTETEAVHVAEVMETRHAAPGFVIFNEGIVQDNLYIIRSGEVELFRTDAGSVPSLAGSASKGSILGLEGLMGRPALRTAMASTEVKFWVVRLDQLPPTVQKKLSESST